MGRTGKFLAGFLMASAPAAVAAETLPLYPSADWQHAAEADRCRAARLFGDDAGRHVLIVEQFAPDGRVSLTLAGPAFERIAETSRVQVGLGAEGSRRWVTPYRAAVPGFDSGLVLASLRVADSDASSAVPELRIDPDAPAAHVTIAQRGRTVRFETGALAGVFAALDACTQNLAEQAGIDVDRLRTAVAAPLWENRGAIRGAIGDSFQENWRHYGRAQGIVHLRVTVNEAGRPEDCREIPLTGDVAPNEAACRIMQKARFTPARDAEGRPVRAFHAATFRDFRHIRSDGIVIGVE